MKTWCSYFGEVVLWSASFGFYFLSLYLLFGTFDAPRPVRITTGLFAGILVTKTYCLWLYTWKDYRKTRHKS